MPLLSASATRRFRRTGEGSLGESKGKAIAAELSRYIAENGYNPRYPGGSTSLVMQWLALQNANVWIGDFPCQWANEWIDDTQAPVKK